MSVVVQVRPDNHCSCTAVKKQAHTVDPYVVKMEHRHSDLQTPVARVYATDASLPVSAAPISHEAALFVRPESDRADYHLALDAVRRAPVAFALPAHTHPAHRSYPVKPTPTYYRRTITVFADPLPEVAITQLTAIPRRSFTRRGTAATHKQNCLDPASYT